MRSSPQLTEVFIEPQFRAIVLASKPIAGMPQPLPVVDIPLNIGDINYLHVPTEKRNVNVKESSVFKNRYV